MTQDEQFAAEPEHRAATALHAIGSAISDLERLAIEGNRVEVETLQRLRSELAEVIHRIELAS